MLLVQGGGLQLVSDVMNTICILVIFHLDHHPPALSTKCTKWFLFKVVGDHPHPASPSLSTKCTMWFLFKVGGDHPYPASPALTTEGTKWFSFKCLGHHPTFNGKSIYCPPWYKYHTAKRGACSWYLKSCIQSAFFHLDHHYKDFLRFKQGQGKPVVCVSDTIILEHMSF